MLRRIGISVAAVLIYGTFLTGQSFQERPIGGIGITIFRDENFRGESATIRQDVPDLRAYRFNDRITSLRVAPGEFWEACELANYRGRCQVFSGEERDLRRIGWTDRISSLRRVRAGRGGGEFRPPLLPPVSKVGIVLYDDPFFRGNSLPIKGAIGNLRSENFHDRAESVQVLSGTWELCAEPGFRRCQVVDRDVAHLSSLGLNKKLSSVRPVGRGPAGGINPPPYAGGARLVLFEGAGYRGPSVTIDSPSPDLAGFGGRARSVQVLSGTWLLCDRPRFSGRCEQISGSVPDLDQWGLGNRVQSARPVGAY